MTERKQTLYKVHGPDNALLWEGPAEGAIHALEQARRDCDVPGNVDLTCTSCGPHEPGNALPESRGHLCFAFDGTVEFYRHEDDVYRAPVRNAFIVATGNRHGRWECSIHHFRVFREVIAPGPLRGFTIWEFRSPSSDEVKVCARLSEPDDRNHSFQHVLTKLDAFDNDDAMYRYNSRRS